jgi:hypothetical protein
MLNIFFFFLQTEQKSFLFILATLGDFAEHAQFCSIFITEPFCWTNLTFCLTQTVVFSLGKIKNVFSDWEYLYVFDDQNLVRVKIF